MTRPTPRSAGYRMPAEWETQDAIWLAWPHNPDTWPAARLGQVRQAYLEVIGALQRDQRVSLIVDDAEAEADVRARGADLSGVTFFHIPTRDTWIRDYGPTFVVHAETGRVAMVKWTFNAWGGKYDDLRADDAVPAGMNGVLSMPVFDAGIVLEGGSIDVNGAGAVLTTEQCLLNPNRNPKLSRADLELYLRDYLGAPHVVWLAEGIVGDDTDGHVDDIARFADATTVLCAREVDPADENHAILEDNYERLRSATDQAGRRLRTVTLPMPDPVVGPDGRLPASYANFYIGNRTVIVPIFGQRKDRTALDVVQSCFPRHRVVGVNCTAMVHGLGAVHCCSQQQPRPVPPRAGR
jgi:agmatine deiminase